MSPTWACECNLFHFLKNHYVKVTQKEKTWFKKRQADSKLDIFRYVLNESKGHYCILFAFWKNYIRL